MESKWPFMLITLGLIFALGLVISGLERTAVINNWTDRRCELPVMMTAMFFKPDSDPRSKGDFAKDNFDFCMKSVIEKFMTILMAPINALLGKHMNLASSTSDAVSIVRDIAQKLYNTLLSFLDKYMRQFNSSIFEISRVMQYLQMAMGRANAMVMSMLYSGISLFRGMINSIQFVIKIILIICGIMIAIIIILFFILFPFIPMILAVLGAVVATVLSFTMVMSAEIANEAEGDKGGFCFATDTKILVKTEDGSYHLKAVQDIKIGDQLGDECGEVTATIMMNGDGVGLYDVHGILVSGSHLILGTDGVWKSVAVDERANKTDKTSKVLYCFNTTSNKLPVYSFEIDKPILFRDWEEITDDKSQYLWNFTILKMLNNNTNYDEWKDSLTSYSEMPLVGSKIKVKTPSGFVEISKLVLNQHVLDRNGREQVILGCIDGRIDDVNIDSDKWTTELYESTNGVWRKGQSTVGKGTKSRCGRTLIVESGEFIIWDEVEKKEKQVRDFTDVGMNEIHKTYPMIASRLRLVSSEII
jgi:hypothetical protein